MAFSRAPFRARAAPTPRAPVFAIGQQVHVVSRAPDRSAVVTLTDGDDRPLLTLAADTEVAILAWRPNWKGNTRYRVRATGCNLEGWISVWNIRGTEAVMPSTPAAPPVRAVPSSPLGGQVRGDPRGGFGQRRP